MALNYIIDPYNIMTPNYTQFVNICSIIDPYLSRSALVLIIPATTTTTIAATATTILPNCR